MYKSGTLQAQAESLGNLAKSATRVRDAPIPLLENYVAKLISIAEHTPRSLQITIASSRDALLAAARIKAKELPITMP